MIELIGGNYYDVSGKDDDHPNQDVTHPGCMYVRIEQIEGKPWYIFLQVYDREFLSRVRIPFENARIEGDKIVSYNEVVTRAILMGYIHLDQGSHSPQVESFLDEAKRLVAKVPQPKKATLQKLLEVATSF